MSRFVAFGVVLLAAVPSARAASGGTPVTIAHSGYLLGANEAPLQATAQPMTFSLFTTASGGTAEWTGTCNVDVNGGYYAVTLGSAPCAGDGLETSDFLAGPATFLEVLVGPTSLTPRQRLSSIPVAETSRDALSLGGSAASVYLKSTSTSLPLQPGGTADGTTFLSGNGTWAVPPTNTGPQGPQGPQGPAGTAATAPTGSVVAFAGATAPAGWLLADGSAVSRTTYAALYLAIGTTYGAGNGTTTFNLPYSGRTEVVRFGAPSNNGIFLATGAPTAKFDPTKFAVNTSGHALTVNNAPASETRFTVNGRVRVDSYFAAAQGGTGNYAMAHRNGAQVASGGHTSNAGYIESVNYADVLVAGDYFGFGGSNGVSSAGDFVSLQILVTPEIPFAAIIKD